MKIKLVIICSTGIKEPRLTLVDLEEHSFNIEDQVPIIVEVSNMMAILTKIRW